jgi:hypothetical protein
MFTIGFGIVSENSRIRIPNPPQKRTTFIEAPPFGSGVKLDQPEIFYTKRLYGIVPLRVTSPASNLTGPEHKLGSPVLFLERGDQAKPQKLD